jgi:hypothetical protein
VHNFRDCRLARQGSLVTLQITFVCDSTVDRFGSTYRHDIKTGLDTQSNFISYNLF